MRCSTVKLDITPSIGLLIGGNVRRDNSASGVHDNLYCNIILLESKDETVCFLGILWLYMCVISVFRRSFPSQFLKFPGKICSMAVAYKVGDFLNMKVG